MTRFFASFFVVCVLMFHVAAPVDAQPAADITALIPFNVQINHVLVPVVQELIVASPAFAAQCARIAEARYVRVIINPV
ncbi:MAG: hypothetical protein ABIX28_04065, partial [Vicinamibacterales bacterium]